MQEVFIVVRPTHITYTTGNGLSGSDPVLDSTVKYMLGNLLLRLMSHIPNASFRITEEE